MASTRPTEPTPKPAPSPSPAERTRQPEVEPVSIPELACIIKSFIFQTQFREYVTLLAYINSSQSASESERQRPISINPPSIFGEGDDDWQTLVSYLRAEIEEFGEGEDMSCELPLTNIWEFKFTCEWMGLRYIEMRERIVEYADFQAEGRKSKLCFWAENCMWDELAKRIRNDEDILIGLLRAPPPLDEGCKGVHHIVEIVRYHYFCYIQKNDYTFYFLTNEALFLSAAKVGQYDLRKVIEDEKVNLERRVSERLASLDNPGSHGI